MEPFDAIHLRYERLIETLVAVLASRHPIRVKQCERLE